MNNETRFRSRLARVIATVGGLGDHLPAPGTTAAATVREPVGHEGFVDDGGLACWEVPLSTATKNDAAQFKAKGP